MVCAAWLSMPAITCEYVSRVIDTRECPSLPAEAQVAGRGRNITCHNEAHGCHSDLSRGMCFKPSGWVGD